MLWTGGKDSALALHESKRAGCEIALLATFAPPDENFRAHPVSFIKLQAAALGLPHQVIHVEAPFREGYENGIRRLQQEHGIDTLVTGDIAEVGEQPNWIRQCAEPLGLRVMTPLWGWDRLALLRRLIADDYGIVFSLVKKPWFDVSWAGRRLDGAAVEELIALRARNGVDVCGENGEYHTLTLNAPMFREKISWAPTAMREEGDMAWVEPGSWRKT